MKKILIIGESCRDIFVYCEAHRLCPDIPVPVLNIIDQTENPGMAKNVHRNVSTLIDGSNILTNSNWYDITKTRYVHKDTNHTFFRVDTSHNMARIKLDDIDFNHELIIISDYNKGFLFEDDIEFICSKHKNVFLDTKKILGAWAEKAKYIKINNYEFNNSKNFINEKLSEKIICTKGSDGATFRNKSYAVEKVDVKDSSGAGDSFMAALVVSYSKTGNIEKSISFANQKASEVVKHRGVTTIR